MIKRRLNILTLVMGILIVSLLFTGGCQFQWSFFRSPALPEEDTLRLLDTGPLTLDPAISQDIGSHTYILHIFSGLVTFDQNLNLMPDIAEMWTSSSDSTVYTFYLRQGIKFHDGKEVKAADFKYSWERACRPETHSPTAATYLADIVGTKEMLAGQAEEISGVEVLDEHTLKVTLEAPKAYFVAELSYPVAFVVDKTNVESGEDWWHQPNGTGPFKLREWTPKERIVLERNEFYYRDKAKVSYILFNLSGGISMSMYENNEIDIAQVSLAYLERVSDVTNPLHSQLIEMPELSLSYIGFDTTKPPFNEVKVRQAFAQSVDKSKIVHQVLKDSVTEAKGILPPGMPGHNPNLQELPYDVTQARQLIAESSYGDVSQLPTITFTTAGEGNFLSSAQKAIICQWKTNLGVNIQVRQLETEAYYYQLDTEKDELFDYGWVADYPDPQDFLGVLFYTGAKNNIGGYSNSEVDSLLDEAAVEADTAQRLALYQEAEQKIVQDAVILPLWFGKNYLLVKPYVKGFAFSPLGFPLLSQVSLEPH